MLKLTPTVIARHEAAEALVTSDTVMSAEHLTRCGLALDAALATRATEIAELTYRLALLRATLVHEDASDFALRLLDAIAEDSTHLAAARAFPCGAVAGGAL